MEKIDKRTMYFECGQWSVIQDAIVNLDEVSATELLVTTGLSKETIKQLQEDCGNSFDKEVNEFLESSYVKHRMNW